MSVIESIHITKSEKTPRCPESWWLDPDTFYQKAKERLSAMKQTRQAGYGRADGVDAQ